MITTQEWSAAYTISPSDRRPRLLRWLLPYHQEEAEIYVFAAIWPKVHENERGFRGYDVFRMDAKGSQYAFRGVLSPNKRIFGEIRYKSSSLPAFSHTYRQICDSLRIE
jgi:hypothetical protein